ncbi:interleukin-18 receptor 1 isoform X1 [Chelonia mydas]|uniref:interleukin-18 receptor 1 isoform X1 n=1 Tax=Chelonia mydas TaxID=8469 RepID=UPI00042BC642|nr:interleukin-18 receptor 1 isoform X1 [Chelonia mydas]XP_043392608.1 interleukin-18 receptor 1 isoform X1 [Chelonia mydas]XP_043392614.1 interleukin-18 receptor 1 isoform X1 [Chelonia mydas]XP_043392616.1 interleukin-18 receptor 1 isoform X1 [Chelonia mydas]XP_043392620.1 interleukin-18 receptor 1 isoform X1 [Chelonia mydas]
MAFESLIIPFLMFLSRATAEELCPLRRSIDVLEGEYFFLCFPGSIQDKLRSKTYTVTWFKESEGKVNLIQATQRLVLNGRFLEFWPAELSDLGNYIYRFSNGTYNVTLQKWSLNVLKRSKDSCFNTNHLSRQVEDVGRGYTLKCNAVHHNKNVTIMWYKNCNIYNSANEKELDFSSLKIEDSGNYTCVVSISHAGKAFNTTSTTELMVKDDAAEVVKLEIIEPGEIYVETQIGKEVILNCTVFLGYSDAAKPIYLLHWVVKNLNSCSESTKEEQSICEKEYDFNSGNKKYASKLLWIKTVKEEDLKCNYTCLLKTTNKPQFKIFKLKKGNPPDLPRHVFTTGIIVAVFFSLVPVLLMVLSVIFRVDLVLFYRDITGKDDTIGDGKEYDAFVSYLKDSISTNVEERKFALEILPRTLEDHFGYKLCIFERDVSPGGAVVDDVHSFIDKSRRLIIILSQNYISDRVMYELETGLHKALVERKIKIILIEYMLISDYNFLPKSLELLPSRRVVKWKEDKSLPSNSRFWKNLRYLMPVKASRTNIRSHNNSMSPTSEEESQATTVCWESKTFL